MAGRLVAACLVLVAASVRAEEWPQWRGPTADNCAPAGATAPVAWSEDEGLAWNVPVPGRGHSSPTLVGPRIYLTTADADAQTQSLLVFERASGKLLRTVVVHEGGLPDKIHPNNSHASSTVASDGQRVFALFCNRGAPWVTAFTLEGEQLWQEPAGKFEPRQFEFGFGSSPMVVDDVVIVATEYDGPESGVYALDAATGKQRWRASRPQGLSYSTPVPLTVDGRTLIVMSGNRQLAAYDAATGAEAWSVSGSTFATCGTMVGDTRRGLAFASGGFPGSFTLAVKLDGDHAVVWENTVKSYEQSLLLAGEYLYATADNGVAFCWRASDGDEQWKRRLSGPFSASPVLVGDRIYATNEAGTTFVFAASPEKCDLLAENRLGNSAFATPAPADGRLYHRYAKDVDGRRQEFLAAIGE